MPHPLYDDPELRQIADLLAPDILGTPNADKLALEKLDSDRFDLAMAALWSIAMDRRWHYLMLLSITATHRNPSAGIRKIFDEHIDKNFLATALVYANRINDALDLKFGGKEAVERHVAAPMRLPARRWNFSMADHWVDAETVRQLLVSIHAATRFIPKRYQRQWIIRSLVKRCEAINKRMINGALAQLLRHSRAIGALRWPQLTAQSRNECIHVRLHYSFGYLTTTVVVGNAFAQKVKVLAEEMGRFISDDERATMDDYFGPQVLGNVVFGILSRIREVAEPRVVQTIFRALYDSLLRHLFDKPEVRKEIDQLGPFPTLVIATHGALAQLPFGALHDGTNYLAERFNVVQAPILFSGKDFQRGKIDHLAMTGGEPITTPGVRVLANTNELEHGAHELDHYRRLIAERRVPIEIFPEEKSLQWDGQTFRWLMERNGIGVLSTHMRSSAQHASEATFSTPDGREIPFSEVMIAPSNVDLLVLAGCVSMSPTDWNAPGESSLVSLCRQNGAKAIIATLWPVDDFAARRYNELLITALADGASRAIAHGVAQRGVMQTTATVGQLRSGERIVHQYKGGDAPPRNPAPLRLDHPYYWGGFFLSGAWR